jgi:hypothetical protein
MLCEEGMITLETRSALLVPQSTKHAALVITHSNTWKIDKHCTNYGMTNHNVKTCKKKKKQIIVATIEATQPSQKPQKSSSYA